MTIQLYRSDAYLREADGKVVSVGSGGLVVDRTVFFAAGGGQPGDSGLIEWAGGSCRVEDSRHCGADQIELVPEHGAAYPQVGETVTQRLDWDRRYRHMRIHTALHLLSVVIPLPVTGGAISAEKGRLDFDMPDALEDRDAVEGELNALIERDLEVSEEWITDTELAANPGLVKTMSVKPPVGAGKVRLVRIGRGECQVDMQPCGGTHVAHTGEIGHVRFGKIEKKGRRNRRVNLHVD